MNDVISREPASTVRTRVDVINFIINAVIAEIIYHIFKSLINRFLI